MKKKQSVDNGCCKDEQKLVKIQDDQKVDNLSFDCMKWTATTQVHANPDFSHQLASAKEVLPRSNAPPRSYPTDIHIINCVFRI